jgi:hypothetical protein
MSEEPEKTGGIRNEKGQFVPGISGNPAGKPKGATSITAAIRKFLEDNPEQFQELFMDYIQDKKHRELLWQMLDGRPSQNTDITSDGEALKTVLVQFMDGKQPDNHTDTE